MIVLQNGEKIIDYHKNSKDEIIETMSVTKSIVALAIAKLLSDGNIDSVDIPVAQFYPEWRQGQKQDIHLKHLMNHSSGLQNVPDTRREIQPSPDFVQLGLCASVVDTPGTHFSYNNKAVNILSGIVHEMTDKSIDRYLEDALFKKMNISKFRWRTDESGHCIAMAGFQTTAEHLAKLGQLVLNKGRWNGDQLIDEHWIETILQQSQPHRKDYGLLWWRMPAYKTLIIDEEQIQLLRTKNIDEEIIAHLSRQSGQYNGIEQLYDRLGPQFFNRLRKVFAPLEIRPWKTKTGPIVGYRAEGYLGQHLVLLPEEEVVAVRLIKGREDYDRETDALMQFPEMIYSLFKEE